MIVIRRPSVMKLPPGIGKPYRICTMRGRTLTQSFSKITFMFSVARMNLDVSRNVNGTSGCFYKLWNRPRFNYYESKIDRFNVLAQNWERLPPLPRKLSECVAIEIKGKIYVAGGYDNDGAYSNAIYRFEYNPSYNEDRFVCKEQTYLDGYNRNILLAKLDTFLYVIVNGSTVHTYDTAKNIWTQVTDLDVFSTQIL